MLNTENSDSTIKSRDTFVTICKVIHIKTIIENFEHV